MTLRAIHPLVLASLMPLILGLLTLMALLLPAWTWTEIPPTGFDFDPSMLRAHARPIPTMSAYAVIVENPLFNVERRPDPPPAPPAPPPLPSMDNYRLVGLVLSPGVHIALVVRQKDGSIMHLRVSDTLDGWTVRAIETTGVELMGQNATTRLAIPRAAPTRQMVDSGRRPPSSQVVRPPTLGPALP